MIFFSIFYKSSQDLTMFRVCKGRENVYGKVEAYYYENLLDWFTPLLYKESNYLCSVESYNRCFIMEFIK